MRNQGQQEAASGTGDAQLRSQGHGGSARGLPSEPDLPIDFEAPRANAGDFASSVVESVPVPIVVLAQDGTIRTVNTAFRELTQMSEWELGGRSFLDLANHLWGVDEIRERFDALLHSQLSATVEFEQNKTVLIKVQALSKVGCSVLLLMMEDITQRREAVLLTATQKAVLESEIEIAARNLTRTREELRGLTAHLFTVQEDERQHVARELHDDISQRMSLLEITLHQIKDMDVAPRVQRKLKSAREQMQALNTDIRQISHRLHPAILHDLGLSPALRVMVKEFGDREGMPATYLSQNVPDNLSPRAATTIYRIAQEALRNVSKHAGKTHVKVVVESMDNRLRLRVMDFGVGFDQESENKAHGLGMVSMQERARLAGGTLTVLSELGEGTSITVEVPLEPRE